MNIFAFDPDPHVSAQWLDDVRLNKMITETAQLLSTAMSFFDFGYYLSDQRFMMTSYTNHPCSVWTRASIHNFAWLTEYMGMLLDVWGDEHKSGRVYRASREWLPDDANYHQHTPFAPCHPGIECDDVHQAYRDYMNRKWDNDTIVVQWTRGTVPYWRLEHAARKQGIA